MLVKRTTLACVIGAAIQLSAGCAHFPSASNTQCLRPVEEVAAPAQARARVNVFMMNGADILEVGGMSELRDAIVAAGYPKVYYAQRPDREWFRRELHRLQREDPTNRFILIGYGTAADQIRQLATHVTGEQIPLDAVVFIDPAGDRSELANCPFPSQVIRSQRWKLSPRLHAAETLTMHGTNHVNVPNSPGTVEQVLAIITASALRVPLNIPPIECAPVIDPKRPIPRPTEPKVMPALPPDWQFLCPGG